MEDPLSGLVGGYSAKVSPLPIPLMSETFALASSTDCVSSAFAVVSMGLFGFSVVAVGKLGAWNDCVVA